MKPKKLPSTRILKKRLWQVFSLFIRTRDQGICISCGKQGEIKEMHCGHYIPKTAGLSIYFDEKNNNCQCPYCNVWMHGNLSAYAVAMRKKYGPDILEELDALKRQTRKISQMEYMELIEKYKGLLEEIKKV